MLDIDPELIAAALERNGDYRVLRRHTPRHQFNDAGNEPVEHGLIIDIETTGLDHNVHEIIEIGLLPFTYSPDGRILASQESYCSFQQPFGPILPEITRLTGIEPGTVKGHMIDRARVGEMVEKATLIVAHNSAFDRRFAEDLCPLLARKPWACSLTQVPWAAEGMGSKLAYIAADLGMIYRAHRAVDDCQATLEILSRPLPQSGRTGFSYLLEQAYEPIYRVKAVRAPYDAKATLKARRYRWDDGTVSGTRTWYKDLPEAEVGLEIDWLRLEVYRYGADVPVVPITPYDRFSARV